MIIQKVGVEDIIGAREFPALIEEYAAESAIAGMPSPRAKLESYRAYERTGMLHVFSAAKDGALVGFITVLVAPLPHYSMPWAVVESFFVASEHRAGGPGLRLLAAAEQQAVECFSPRLQVCAPMNGRLIELLPKCDYVETNRVFTKKLDTIPLDLTFAPPAELQRNRNSLAIPSMSSREIAAVRALEDWTLATQEQIDLPYEHAFHAGIYSRTVVLPAGRYMTGAEVKTATLLHIVGDVWCRTGGERTRIIAPLGARLCAEAGRKQLFTAITDTAITMEFATDARTIEEAEAEFTDEAHRLASRRPGARNTVIGEQACLAESL